MSESYGHPYGNLVAAARVTISEGSVFFTTGTDVYGFSSVALNGTVVELTLGPNSQIDPTDAVVLATAVTTGAVMPHVNHASDTLVEVRMLDTDSSPTEAPFNITMFRKGA